MKAAQTRQSEITRWGVSIGGLGLAVGNDCKPALFLLRTAAIAFRRELAQHLAAGRALRTVKVRVTYQWEEKAR